ncbi:hypothetical protein [Wolbachia endosymbiont of Drosophila barbarae]|uniref:hypothetical protein n=2 Tax=Wolbachieae TaxID=952 RepID=UPI0037F225EC
MENWIPVSSTGMTPSCSVHVAINIKKFTKQKKGKRSPSHCLFSVLAFFKSETLQFSCF